MNKDSIRAAQKRHQKVRTAGVFFQCVACFERYRRKLDADNCCGFRSVVIGKNESKGSAGVEWPDIPTEKPEEEE